MHIKHYFTRKFLQTTQIYDRVTSLSVMRSRANPECVSHAVLASPVKNPTPVIPRLSSLNHPGGPSSWGLLRHGPIIQHLAQFYIRDCSVITSIIEAHVLYGKTQVKSLFSSSTSLVVIQLDEFNQLITALCQKEPFS